MQNKKENSSIMTRIIQTIIIVDCPELRHQVRIDRCEGCEHFVAHDKDCVMCEYGED